MEKRKIVVAHSPDADDAFMFYALATGKVRSDLVEFEHLLSDIQTLNVAAHEGKYEMTAISYHAYPYVQDKYVITAAGSSVGDGYGPILVSKDSLTIADLPGKTIAVPGKMTTAYLTLMLYQPSANVTVLPFDEILEAVEAGKVDAGLIIHEGQLSYTQTGVKKLVDLGVWWKEQYDLPLPLGCNAILRDLPADVQKECGLRLQQTIQYALDNRDAALEHALQFARGLDTDLADRFVGMYVNHFTTEMRPEVIESAQKLLDMGHAAGLIPEKTKVEYV